MMPALGWVAEHPILSVILALIVADVLATPFKPASICLCCVKQALEADE